MRWNTSEEYGSGMRGTRGSLSQSLLVPQGDVGVDAGGAQRRQRGREGGRRHQDPRSEGERGGITRREA